MEKRLVRIASIPLVLFMLFVVSILFFDTASLFYENFSKCGFRGSYWENSFFEPGNFYSNVCSYNFADYTTDIDAWCKEKGGGLVYRTPPASNACMVPMP